MKFKWNNSSESIWSSWGMRTNDVICDGVWFNSARDSVNGWRNPFELPFRALHSCSRFVMEFTWMEFPNMKNLKRTQRILFEDGATRMLCTQPAVHAFEWNKNCKRHYSIARAAMVKWYWFFLALVLVLVSIASLVQTLVICNGLDFRDTAISSSCISNATK